MTRARAIACAVLVTAMIAGPAAAAKTAASVVSEAVVSKRSPDGSPTASFVEQLVRLHGKAAAPASVSIPNASDLQSYRNLSGFRGASGEGGGLVWRSTGTRDVMALAKGATKPPVAVTVKYFLDGKEMTAKDLKGRSGVVRIDVEIDNVTGTAKTLTYKGVSSPYLTSVASQYVPIEYMVRVDFPTDRWSNVGGQDVSVLPGNDSQVASASGFLTPPITDTSRTATFEARSGDILTPKIQVFATPQVSSQVIESLQAQYEGLKALYGGSGQISANLKKVYNGANALVDGLEKMLAGVGTNDPTSHKPVVTLDGSGVPTTLLGAIGLIGDGVSDKILPGIGSRDAKTGEGVIVLDDKGNATTLIGALQSQKNTYDDKLIPAIQKAIEGLDSFHGQVAAGGNQLGAGQTALISNLQTAFRGGLQHLIAALGDKDNLPSFVDASGAPCAPGPPGCVPTVQTVLFLFQKGLGDSGSTVPGFLSASGLPCGATPGPGCLTPNVQTALYLLQQGLGDTSNVPAFVSDTTGLPCVPGPGCTTPTVQTGLALLIAGLGDTATTVPGFLDANGSPCGATPGPGCTTPNVQTGLYLLQQGLGDKNAVPAFVNDTTGLPCTPGPGCTTPTVQTVLATIDAVGGGALAGLVCGAVDCDTALKGVIDGLQSKALGGLQSLSGALQAEILAGLAQLSGGLQTKALAGLTQLRTALQTNFLGGLTQLVAGLQTDDPDNPGFREGLLALLAGVGQTSDPASTSTIIGALKLLSGGSNALVQGVLDGLDQIKGGFTNPEFTKPQSILGGKTPKQYFQECPGCFDPTFKAFDPRTADPSFQPSLLEVFTLFSEGVKAALPKLQSLDAAQPGLVEGLKQVSDGLAKIASKLQTFDPKNPGLVDGLQLVHNGLQQAANGVFTITELGVNTMLGQVGDQGDGVSRVSTALADAADAAARSSSLGQSADAVSTTYVFVFDAQSTARHDNTIRWALTGAVLALMGGLAWRPRLLPR